MGLQRQIHMGPASEVGRVIWPADSRAIAPVAKHSLSIVCCQIPTWLLKRRVWPFSFFLRSNNYCQRIIMPNRSSWYFKALYGDFDFRRRVTRTQIFIAHLYFWSRHVMDLIAFVAGVSTKL